MNLIENHKGKHLTFDNRTFSECSKRMQRLTPTLPRKFDRQGDSQEDSDKLSYATTDSQFPTSSENDERPIPPPRPRRINKSVNVSPLPVKRPELTSAGSPCLNRTDQINHPSTPLFEENSENRDQIDLSLDVVVKMKKNGSGDLQKGHQNMQRRIPILPILKRPIQHFLSWMTDIANNVEIHSCPP